MDLIEEAFGSIWIIFAVLAILIGLSHRSPKTARFFLAMVMINAIVGHSMGKEMLKAADMALGAPEWKERGAGWLFSALATLTILALLATVRGKPLFPIKPTPKHADSMEEEEEEDSDPEELLECPLCGHQNPLSTTSCQNCRASEIDKEWLVCKSCNFHNPPRAKFCGNCSATMQVNAEATKEPKTRRRPKLSDNPLFDEDP